MPLIWTDSLATGLRQIDLQHQELIELINALESADANGQRHEALDVVLPKLTAYVLFHFGTEDAMLPSVKPEHAALHRQQHQEFTARVAALREQPQETIDIPALVGYLNQWLVEHIMRTDRDLAREILAKQT